MPPIQSIREWSASRLRCGVSRGTALTYSAVLLILAVVFAIGVTVWQMRRVAVNAAWANTDNLAVVLAEQTDRSVQAVDMVVREVQDKIAERGLATPQDFRRALGTEQVHEFLRSRAERLPQVDALALIGADGWRVNNSVAWPVVQVDLSDRDYMRHFAAYNDPGMFISKPILSSAMNVWTIVVTRRVNSRDGTFLGVVLASMPLEVFAGLYASIDLPHNLGFMLLRRDGTILARHPDQPSHVGQKMPVDSPWYALVTNGGGNYESPGYFDRSARLIAVRPLHGYQLVVNVGMLTDAALMRWRQTATLIWLGTGFAAGFLLLLLFMLRRQLQRLEESRSALLESETRLDIKSHELTTTLASMDQGLMMVDGSGIVAVCNTRAIEMLDLPPELMDQRPPFTALAAQCTRNGVFPLMREALAAEPSGFRGAAGTSDCSGRAGRSGSGAVPRSGPFQGRE